MYLLKNEFFLVVYFLTHLCFDLWGHVVSWYFLFLCTMHSVVWNEKEFFCWLLLQKKKIRHEERKKKEFHIFHSVDFSRWKINRHQSRWGSAFKKRNNFLLPFSFFCGYPHVLLSFCSVEHKTIHRSGVSFFSMQFNIAVICLSL